MKTHKVIDIIIEIGDVLFYGTMEECYQWKRNQGYGYRVVELDEKEYNIINEA